MKIHTFELCIRLTPSEYFGIRDHLFEISKGQHRQCFEDKKRHQVKCSRWSDNGIFVVLQASAHKFPACYLHLVVTPAALLGNNSPAALFNPTPDTLPRLRQAFLDMLKLLPGNLPPDGFYLYRLDLTQDRVVESRTVVSAYMELLRKGYCRRGWVHPSYGAHQDERSFRCFCPRYQVTVYDKLDQIASWGGIADEDPIQRLLRIETALYPEGVCRFSTHYDITHGTWLDQLYVLGINGDQIMSEILKQLIPPGDYYSLDAARSIVEQAPWKASKRRHISNFLFALTHLPTVDTNTICGLKNGRKRLKQLLSLRINPVTIKTRTGFSFLPSLYPSSGQSAKIVS